MSRFYYPKYGRYAFWAAACLTVGQELVCRVLSPGATHESASPGAAADSPMERVLRSLVEDGSGWHWLVSWLVAVSAVSFAVYWLDKRAALKGESRVPEAVLLELALAGGTPGAFVASRVFRHKTLKLSFRRKFWAVVAVQCVAVVALVIWRMR